MIDLHYILASYFVILLVCNTVYGVYMTGETVEKKPNLFIETWNFVVAIAAWTLLTMKSGEADAMISFLFYATEIGSWFYILVKHDGYEYHYSFFATIATAVILIILHFCGWGAEMLKGLM